MAASYQDIFQFLKGVSLSSKVGLVIPIPKTAYVLFPINCHEATIDEKIVTMLTVARNDNVESFLTYFTATNERTASWLINTVSRDKARILFSIKHYFTGELYGYMGLAYGNLSGTYIEADAIVRYTYKPIHGLMKKAFTTLIDWVQFDIGISNVWIRVLADNSAIHFYEKCGFRIEKLKDLFMVLDNQQQLVELKEDSESGSLQKSHRCLAYMTNSESCKSN
jgi:RimJ/RimL family protein N-acetyltransferase